MILMWARPLESSGDAFIMKLTEYQAFSCQCHVLEEGLYGLSGWHKFFEVLFLILCFVCRVKIASIYKADMDPGCKTVNLKMWFPGLIWPVVSAPLLRIHVFVLHVLCLYFLLCKWHGWTYRKLKKILFIYLLYFWLCWVLFASHWLSLVLAWRLFIVVASLAVEHRL